MIDFNFEKSEKTLNFRFIGRLDTENTQKIANKIEEHFGKEIDKSFKIIFDIQEVDYMASSFIRICIKAARIVDKGNFAIINSKPMIKKIFKISGLADVLNVS